MLFFKLPYDFPFVLHASLHLNEIAVLFCNKCKKYVCLRNNQVLLS